MNECKFCGLVHVNCICPTIKNIEYHENGTIKKIEFKESPVKVGNEAGKFWKTKEEGNG